MSVDVGDGGEPGSPPRVRGKEGSYPSTVLRKGITPARAGKSCSRPSRPTRARDHPRACGEKKQQAAQQVAAQGSPPRVRGKGIHGIRIERPPGITPARAGKSGHRVGFLTAFGDHPRACGEKCNNEKAAPERQGSPPRVRGKETRQNAVQTRPGITPARAGKRAASFAHSGKCRDHPRACGEKDMLEKIYLHYKGSPPRVRGKDVSGSRTGVSDGITPARAGKSPLPDQQRWMRRDHPRACGEKAMFNPHPDIAPGSPPRVRGKDRADDRKRRQAGITPARAGKRKSRTASRSASRDHPRACGEKPDLGYGGDSAWGSPPRVRGKGRAGLHEPD